MKTIIPHQALQQHMAVLGKTGSGKTTTAKLAIEQVVEEGARVCILDPIKSDWWGLISSADGKHPGLPFHILGGPRGHVPLHASAGRAIGELVGHGSLPLSIIDMADFEPGGMHRFFVDFAPALMRAMRGVVYLVIEEAHEFAPKERSGMGHENMAIYWAKKLATAGRSKGIRLVLLSQRVQSLHNALLGSCETVIAHRLTTPADQEPVVRWLKANVEASVMKTVASELASLPTGTGWLCSGEAKIFERYDFPKVKTYDNTATPTGDTHEHRVTTAPVDLAALRAIVGEAVKEAEENDPVVLKRLLTEARSKGGVDPKAADEAAQAFYARGRAEAAQILIEIAAMLRDRAAEIAGLVPPPPPVPQTHPKRDTPNLVKQFVASAPVREKRTTADTKVNGAQQRILNAIAELEQLGARQPERVLVAFLAGYTHLNSKGLVNALGALRTEGLIDYPTQGVVALTAAGRKVARPPARPQSTRELQDRLVGLLGGASARILEPLIEAYPNAMEREKLAERANYGHLNSKGFVNAMGRLRSLGFIDYPERGRVVARPVLFLAQ